VGVVIIDNDRDGEKITGSNEMSDNWLHTTRPDYSGHGLPHRSLLGGIYRSSSYLDQTGIRIVPGVSAIASFDFNAVGNIYHFASSVMVGFLARIYYLDRNSSINDRHKNIVELNDKGFDNAIFLAHRHQMSDWALAVARLALGGDVHMSYSPDLADLASRAPVCFEKAVVLGKSINIFSGTWDAVRFREVVTAQLGVTFRKDTITLCLRRNVRRLFDHGALVDLLESKSRGLPVKVAYFEDLTFLEQVLLMSRTAILVAVHGAGLTNSIFLPVGAAVLEISPFRFNYNLYERIAMNAGLVYVRYVTSFGEISYAGSTRPEHLTNRKKKKKKKEKLLTNRQCNNIDKSCLDTDRDVDLIYLDIRRITSYVEAVIDVIE
jgi:hypothetical protein